MSNYRTGDVIRMTREYLGISREELSDGICSPQTLYRLEYGKTRVKKELYAELMAKMERVPEKNYAVCVGKNMELLEERELLEKAMQDYDYEKADQYLKKLKEKADGNMITEQYVLKAEALLDYYCKRSDGETTVKRLEEAIR
ncbi:MAG: helix-turn-helix transcriptional regulator, partial [Clostridiales bacterium]|nr:helix-turn-helix transcriptional regulator [Clostridiales bacterium]